MDVEISKEVGGGRATPAAEAGDFHNSTVSEIKDGAGGNVPYYRLFSFADALDQLLMLVGSVAAIGNGVSMPLMTIIFGELVNSFGESANTKELVHAVSKVSLKFVYLAAGSGVAAFAQVACWLVTGERQAARIRSFYLTALLRQEIAFFDAEASTGEIIGRMSGDTVLIQDAMGEKVGKFIQQIATFVGGFVIAFIKGWLLTLVMLSSIPALVISGAILSIMIAKQSSNGQGAYSLAAAVVEETLGSIRTVVAFSGERRAAVKYDECLDKAYRSGIREGLVTGLGSGAVMFIMLATYALAVWYGGKMILEKGYTGGDVISVILAILTGSMALGQASPSLSAFAAGQAVAAKMFEVIDRNPKIDGDIGRKLEDVRGEIELRNVGFSYPTRPNERIFDRLNLLISSETMTALVGESGSGKSTIISLIERFYDPSEGEVLIDGHNLRELQLKWFRSKIGLVSQEPVLFTSSIRENIAYGKDGATNEDIRAAVELANVAKFIDRLPQGLDTMVGEHGVQLSGGQKQRIAIARAIIKEPRILLLDEATSALDTESERVVQEALDKIMVNRTTVVIAHRLTTVRKSDTIVVLRNGNIVEKGSHSELIKDQNGAYSQLIRMQDVTPLPETSHPEDSDRPDIVAENISLSGDLVSTSIQTATALEGPEEKVGSDVKVERMPSDVSLWRVARLNKPEIPVLILGALSAAASGAILPIIGILFSGMLKTFTEPAHKLRKDARFWSLIFLVLGVAHLVIEPLRSYFFAVSGGRLIQRVRSTCFHSLMRMEIGWFDQVDHSSGAIGSRLSIDAASLKAVVGIALGLVFQNIATGIAGLVIAFAANWQLACIVLAMLPVLAVSGYIELKFMKGFTADAKKKYEEASQVASDAIGSIRTIASLCLEGKVTEMYKEKCRGPIRTGVRRGMLSGIGFGLAMLLLYLVYACSFYAGARLVEQGKTTFSDVFRVFFALAIASLAISQSSTLLPDLTKAKVSAASIFEIVDLESKIDPSSESGTTIDNLKGEIEFRNVSFKYPSRPDIVILNDLCLLIKCNKTTAIVGESGSGKSTVISLLQRFYDPNVGNILVDGTDIRKIQLKWLRQQMGLVSQEPVLFNDTIRANIAYGKDGEATEAEIIAAAELANAHSFISGMQNGYDTVVGERGIQLSGGQKQRVAIARAIVRSPRMLLLDEATSALDTESERVVQEALDRVAIGRTTVVIAHRLSTIMGADLIAVMKNGSIVEEGDHRW
ncbi:hypothetical protein MLD38_035984 [Melastoma candidum]|uniref:Uncharacterized protein n=1 Tax=Melastoma candidum TaxID=119954 RepID=A0ACB9LJ65_9MYRT|nr:hypothetical protein MLD38_035984 [Melastoma candidum]